jgi:hypothetical protein
MGRTIAIAGALALIGTQADAQPAATCIPRQQASDMIVALVPPFIGKARSTCAGRLPASAFLTGSRSVEMETRYQTVSKSRLPSAARALRAMGDNKLPPELSDQSVVQMMGETLPSMAFRDGNADSCAALNDLLEAIAPLTPDQAGRLFVSIAALAGVKSPAICAS